MTTNPVMSITDEQIAEIEAQCEAANKHDGSLIVGADEVSAIISRLRAAEMDAARYSWIRKQHNDAHGNTLVAVWHPGEWVSLDTDVFCTYVDSDDLNLDLAIDTAMKGEQQ